MAQPTKQALEEKGLVRIQIVIPKNMEKLMRILSKKLESGELKEGSTVKLQ